jgi:hypothetical protein
MTANRLLLPLALLTSLVLCACQNAEDMADPKKSGWIELFTGGDLSNFNTLGDAEWQLIDNYVESDGNKGLFFVTKESFTDFRLTLEFFPSSDVNSGVFMRCEGPTQIANETCYELNIMDEHPNRLNSTGSIINLAPPLVEIETGGHWNSFDITVQGTRITIYLNDTLVVDFENSSFSSGPIGFQANGGLIRFRDIRIQPL